MKTNKSVLAFICLHQRKIFNHPSSLSNFSKFPVDIVYCWVNGNDNDWQKDKLKWQEILNINHGNSINTCRFTDNKELKYSLRSVAHNLQWINHIYIVTNGQIPDWLDKNHPKITIVNHNEIMPFDSLPTFNSEAIETCIANIPNLSEHFLYANDDCFVYSTISPDYFFDRSGNPIVRLIKQPITDERIEKELYAQNIIYCCNLIKEKYGKKYFHELTHNINSYRKSYFLECKETFKEEFEKTCHDKFRSPHSIQQILINIYMIVKKHCKCRKIYTWDKYLRENLYIQLSNPVIMNEKIQKYKETLKLFCINDDEKTLQEDREKLENYLSFLFPDKQEWELF